MTDATPNAPAEGQAQGQGEGQQTADKAWYDGLGFKDEDVGYIQNKAWKAPGDVVNAYKNLEKFHGVPAEQIIKLPKDFADEKAMGDVYNRLGRPESADKYDYTAPEGVQVSEERMKWAKETAHKLGLNKSQFAALTNATLEYEGGLIKGMENELALKSETQMNDLKKEWGAAFDERKVLGQRAVRTFLPGDGEAKEAMLGAIEGAIGSAAMLKLFANIGERLGEDQIISSNGDRPFGYTPQQAMADKQSLMAELSDPANRSRLDAYNNGAGKDYDKMQQLLKIIAG